MWHVCQIFFLRYLNVPPCLRCSKVLKITPFFHQYLSAQLIWMFYYINFWIVLIHPYSCFFKYHQDLVRFISKGGRLYNNVSGISNVSSGISDYTYYICTYFEFTYLSVCCQFDGMGGTFCSLYIYPGGEGFNKPFQVTRYNLTWVFACTGCSY